MANRAIGNRLSDILKDVEMKLDGVKEQFLLEMAKELTDLSPVDTGDYVLSHSIGTASLAGRFTGNYRSIGPRGQDPSAKRSESFSNLSEQIAGLPKDAKTIFVGNSSPHAKDVEEGGASWKRNGYKVYAIVRNRADVYLANAIAKVKGST
jgi:hypothetical protein